MQLNEAPDSVWISYFKPQQLGTELRLRTDTLRFVVPAGSDVAPSAVLDGIQKAIDAANAAVHELLEEERRLEGERERLAQDVLQWWETRRAAPASSE